MPHIKFLLDGVDIIANGSGSHHQLRKLNYRIDLVRGATAKARQTATEQHRRHHTTENETENKYQVPRALHQKSGQERL
eukprot:3838343-Amphidinium_carterae.1